MSVILQACVIPFREQKGTLKFCLITSMKKKKWIFPKGIVEPGETIHDAGLKEAWEEAGIRGSIVGPAIGIYEDEKWGSALQIHVLLMRVTECANDWPEMKDRQRSWMSRADAAKTLGHPKQKEFLLQLTI